MKVFILATALVLGACNSASSGPEAAPLPGGAEHTAWSGLGEGETLHFSGTEPFWGGKVTGTALVWETPDDPDGTVVTVTRFDGRNGMGLSGTLASQPFELAASEAACSDGMSDRTYPFTVTVRRAGEILRGCGWSDAHPFKGAANP